MSSPPAAAAGGAQQAPPSTSTTQPQPLAQIPKTPQFPPHNAPRVWLITNGASPVSINLARQLLGHGDYIVLCVPPKEVGKDEQRSREFNFFLQEIKRHKAGRKQSAQAEAAEVISDGDMHVEHTNGDEHDDEQGSAAEKEKTSSKTSTKMKPWRERIRTVPLDNGSTSGAQAAVAEALTAFKSGIDILLISTPSAVLGTVEELAQNAAASALVRDQFDTNFFGNVALIKAVLPSMRARKNGHIVLLSGITGHLGTPGIATYCASQWAMEGYCDSLAYEIAPFNVRMTIVQPNIEINILTNRIRTVPPMDAYAPDVNPAPLSREIFSGLLDKLEGAVPPDAISPRQRTWSQASPISPASILEQATETPTSAVMDGPVLTTGDMLSAPMINSVYAPLSPATQSNLVSETVFALAAIGGHDNPPARHIVGFEGVASVKEKLKTVSEELEDFIEVSAAVDFAKEEADAQVGG